MAILKDVNKKGKKIDSPTSEGLIHSMDQSSPPISGGEETNKKSKKYLAIGVIVIVLGILTGVLLPKGGGGGLPMTKGGGDGLLTGGKKVFGSDDTKLFKDTTEGKIEEGGIDGEGTHKLVRPGGESQTVYINSTVLDLDQFVGKKVKVWGQTHAAQKAGWLMDVGRVEILE